MHPLFQSFLEHQRFIVLDGALATELEKKGLDLNHPLWSAKALLESPETILEVHLEYLNAGADIITTSTYQASFEGFNKAGIPREIQVSLFEKSIDLALEARSRFVEKKSPGVKPLVAISLGPYGAFLADGSEYSGDYDIGMEELKSFHRQRLLQFIGTRADILLFETLPSCTEAEVLNELLNELDIQIPAIFSFSARNGNTISDGTPFANVLKKATHWERVIGMGINCTSPKHIESLLKIAQPLYSKYLIAYPNSGENWNSEQKIWQGNSQKNWNTFQALESWLDAGATVIGGCCRTGPSQIAELAMKKWKSDL